MEKIIERIKNIKITQDNLVIGVILLGLFMVGLASSYFTFMIAKKFSNRVSPTPTPVSLAESDVDFGPTTDEVNKEGVYNTVLLGYGGAGHAGSLLTDSIIVVHVDTNNNTAALISIPRDLWVNGNHKINAEASINGFSNVGGVVKNVTGLSIDYFVAIDFSSFEKLIDDLGGIAVQVPRTFDDAFYPVAGLENETCGKTLDEINELKAKYSDAALEMQFTCRYEHIHFDAGPADLDGATALKFVRSRHGDSDFGRSERQFAVLKGILSKLISLHAFEKTNKTIENLSSMVKTNLGLGAVRSLIEVIGDTGKYSVTDIHLTTENVLSEGRSSAGAYILNPKAGMFNFSGIKNYIASNINK